MRGDWAWPDEIKRYGRKTIGPYAKCRNCRPKLCNTFVRYGGRALCYQCAKREEKEVRAMTDEPLNVHVARALLGPSCKAVFKEVTSGVWMMGLEELVPDLVPDYSTDYEFLWRVCDENNLHVYPRRVGTQRVTAQNELVSASGRTRAEAVLRWLIAAKEAGVEVKLSDQHDEAQAIATAQRDRVIAVE